LLRLRAFPEVESDGSVVLRRRSARVALARGGHGRRTRAAGVDGDLFGWYGRERGRAWWLSCRWMGSLAGHGGKDEAVGVVGEE
jgi:hypothetical protein